MQALYRMALYPASLEVGWNPFPEATNSSARVIAVTEPLSDSEEQTTLSRMLSAIGVTDDEVSIHQLQAGETAVWPEFRGAKRPLAVLLFGVEPARLAIRATLPQGQPSRFDGALWIVAPPVSTLVGNAEAKRKLWAEGLQPVKAVLALS